MLHEHNEDDSDNLIMEHFILLRAQIAEEVNHHTTIRAFWTQRSLRKRCMVGFLTFFAGQGTGTFVVNSQFILYFAKFSTFFAILFQQK